MNYNKYCSRQRHSKSDLYRFFFLFAILNIVKNKKVLSNYSNALSQSTIFSLLELIEKIRNDNIRYTINYCISTACNHQFEIWSLEE